MSIARIQIVIFCLSFPWATSVVIGGEGADLGKLLKEKTPSTVTVKFILKMSMGGMMGEDQEDETEATGVMIDPKGVVLCSNTQLGGFMGMLARMMGEMGSQFSANPTDIKVLVGEDTEGKEAEIVARDTELDLAWIRIKTPPEHPYEFVDLTKSADVEVGQEIVGVRRLGKHFGRVAAAGSGRIGGITSKPRKLFVPTGGISGMLGLPVYRAGGEVVGVLVMQMPDSEDADMMNPAAMLGMLSDMQSLMDGLILPAGEVVKATKRALEKPATE